MSRIGVFFRTAFNARKKDTIAKTVIAWNANNLSQEGIKELLKSNKFSKESKGEDKNPQQVSDEKAASEMKRLANAISRGFR